MLPGYLRGQTCTLVLFEEPGGEIESLYVLEGVLDVDADGSVSLAHDGGDLPIPRHLADAIEEVTDELRECSGPPRSDDEAAPESV